MERCGPLAEAEGPSRVGSPAAMDVADPWEVPRGGATCLGTPGLGRSHGGRPRDGGISLFAPRREGFHSTRPWISQRSGSIPLAPPPPRRVSGESIGDLVGLDVLEGISARARGRSRRELHTACGRAGCQGLEECVRGRPAPPRFGLPRALKRECLEVEIYETLLRTLRT